ncbi:YcnI family protein [Microbacterium sp. HA-8]|uniref:YcnI family copper-binding membrane protein n=1 Tax=Microbacterium sp. HA-8 TaxID=3234200 RepID=UPI0038F7A0C9
MTTITNPTPRAAARRRALTRIGIGTAVAAGLVFAAPLAAQAHVTVTPNVAATAGGSGVLTFAFQHACEGSATTALEIDVPDGIASAYPTALAGWRVDVQRDGEDGPVSQIVYTADEPHPDGIRAAVEVAVQYSTDTGGETLAFPVNQVCEDGNIDWSQIAEDGEDPHDLDSPAPTVTVAEAAEDGGDHHSGGTEEATGQTTADDTSPLPIVLGAGGLVLGAGALVVALLALRRRA